MSPFTALKNLSPFPFTSLHFPFHFLFYLIFFSTYTVNPCMLQKKYTLHCPVNYWAIMCHIFFMVGQIYQLHLCIFYSFCCVWCNWIEQFLFTQSKLWILMWFNCFSGTEFTFAYVGYKSWPLPSRICSTFFLFFLAAVPSARNSP
jgi:hypothetical protein